MAHRSEGDFNQGWTLELLQKSSKEHEQAKCRETHKSLRSKDSLGSFSLQTRWVFPIFFLSGLTSGRSSHGHRCHSTCLTEAELVLYNTQEEVSTAPLTRRGSWGREKHRRCFSELQDSIHLRLLILILTLREVSLIYEFPHELHQNRTTVTLASWEALKRPKITQEICDRAENRNIAFYGLAIQLL